MGEEILFLFPSLLGLGGEAALPVGVPWACYYLSCLLVDDHVDGGAAVSPYDPMLAQFLADEAHRRLKAALDPSSSIWDDIARYRLQSWRAMSSELNVRTGSRRVSTSDWEVALEQGRKAAMAKTCACALQYAHARSGLSELQEMGVDRICAGVQLLDDLSDYLEDHRVGRRNLLLLRAQEWFEAQDGACSFDTAAALQVRGAIVLSGGVRASWLLAAVLLKEGVRLLDQGVGSDGAYYFLDLAAACEHFGKRLLEVEAQYKDLPSTIGTAFAGGEEASRTVLASPRFGSTWLALEALLREGPTASN